MRSLIIEHSVTHLWCFDKNQINLMKLYNFIMKTIKIQFYHAVW